MRYMAKRCLPLAGAPDEMALQAAGFTALLDGLVPTPGELAVGARLSVERAESAARSLAARETLLTDADGRIEAIAGLTLRPTRHELSIVGTRINTWCAFDSVGIPAALGADAIARTSCGHCGEDLEVSFTEGTTDRKDLWGWIPALDPAEQALMTNFCSRADLFCSREHLDAWHDAAGRPEGDACSMEELLDMGRATWEHCAA